MGIYISVIPETRYVWEVMTNQRIPLPSKADIKLAHEKIVSFLKSSPPFPCDASLGNVDHCLIDEILNRAQSFDSVGILNIKDPTLKFGTKEQILKAIDILMERARQPHTHICCESAEVSQFGEYIKPVRFSELLFAVGKNTEAIDSIKDYYRNPDDKNPVDPLPTIVRTLVQTGKLDAAINAIKAFPELCEAKIRGEFAKNQSRLGAGPDRALELLIKALLLDGRLKEAHEVSAYKTCGGKTEENYTDLFSRYKNGKNPAPSPSYYIKEVRAKMADAPKNLSAASNSELIDQIALNLELDNPVRAEEIAKVLATRPLDKVIIHDVIPISDPYAEYTELEPFYAPAVNLAANDMKSDFVVKTLWPHFITQCMWDTFAEMPNDSCKMRDVDQRYGECLLYIAANDRYPTEYGGAIDDLFDGLYPRSRKQ